MTSSIRDVIRYTQKFKGALAVIYLDDRLLEGALFASLIKDISLLHDAGFRVILAPGASKRISEILGEAGIPWTIHDNCRVTDESAMPLIKMAAFDVSNSVMTLLAGEKKTAVIGNWVRARGKGVIGGIDYATNGTIDSLDIDAIGTVLEKDFIPIFPCIGWSGAGRPYNISSIELAQQIAIHLKADKLFFLLKDAPVNNETFVIPPGIGLAEDGAIPAMDLEETAAFIEANRTAASYKRSVEHGVSRETKDRVLLLFGKAIESCRQGVTRVHVMNGSVPGSLPCETFSNLGTGTMVYSSGYGRIRNMRQDDIPFVLEVMYPFIKEGILLPRTKETLLQQLDCFIVYEMDGAVRACSALIPYDDGQMEIAAIAVEKAFSSIGIGQKMVEALIRRAHDAGCKDIFLLTTQTTDWFESLGFKLSDVSTLPQKRKALWTPERGSRVLRYAGE